MILADSDVLIDYLRGHEPARSRIGLELAHYLATSAVSAFELLSGARGGRHQEKISILLAAMRILPVDAAAAATAAKLRLELESQGFSSVASGGVSNAMTLILVCYQVETNYPRPCCQAAQRLGVCRHPRQASFKLTHDPFHRLENPIGKFLLAQLIPYVLLGIEFRRISG